MKKTFIILGVVLAVLVLVLVYAKNNIQKNISGKIESISITNVYSILTPKVDLNVKFKIVNNSKFSFKLRNFKIKVFDVETNVLLTENEVLQVVEIPVGESIHNTQLLGNEILGNLNEALSSSGKQLRVLVSFKAFLVNIEFEELITI